MKTRNFIDVLLFNQNVPCLAGTGSSCCLMNYRLFRRFPQSLKRLNIYCSPCTAHCGKQSKSCCLRLYQLFHQKWLAAILFERLGLQELVLWLDSSPPPLLKRLHEIASLIEPNKHSDTFWHSMPVLCRYWPCDPSTPKTTFWRNGSGCSCRIRRQKRKW